MIKTLLEKTKETLQPKFGYKEIFERKTYVSLQKTDENTISEAEFCRRYQTMGLCAWSALVFCLGALMQTSAASDIIGIIICVLAAALFGMFYFSYIYKMWAARLHYDQIFKGADPGKMDFARFVDDVIVNPSNMIPIKIKRKAGHG